MAGQLGQVIGGGQQRYQGVQPGSATGAEQTGDLIMKMGNSFLQKKLQEQQETQFVKGMQRVATGEAYKDIKDGSNPLLTGIFGPSATVQGAAAMAKVQGVEDYTTQMYTDMQGNAAMSPEQFRQHAVEGMKQHLTGDSNVDNVIQTKMVENLGPLMKAQAKANYAYVQQQTANNYNGLVSAAADKFHAVAIQRSQGVLSDGDFELAKGNLLASVQPLAGMNPETYKKALMDTAVLQMNKGNLWVDRVFQQTGMYDHLDADDQAKMITSRQSAQTKVMNEYGFNKYGAAVAQLAGNAENLSPEQIHKAANDINQRVMNETGSEVGIISMTELIAMDRSSYSRMYRMNDKMTELRAKAALDAQSKADLASTAVQLAHQGAGTFAVGMGIPKAEFDLAMSSAMTGKLAVGKPAEALDMVVQNYNHGDGYINPQFQSMLMEPIRQIGQGGIPGPELDRTMTWLDQLAQHPQGKGTADAYLGAENVIKVERYRSALVALKGDKIAASKAAFSVPIVKGPSLGSAEMQPVVDRAITQKIEGKGFMNSVSRWWDNVPSMSDSAKAIVTQAIKGDAEAYQNNLGMDPNSAVLRAMDGPAKAKVDVLGAYAYAKSQDQAPLASMVGTDDRTMARIFPKFIQEQARKQGTNLNIKDGGTPMSEITPKKGEASYWSSLADLGGVFGTAKSDLSLQRGPDGKDADGKEYGTFMGFVSQGDNSAVVRFTSKDLKSWYEDHIKNHKEDDLGNILLKTGL